MRKKHDDITHVRCSKNTARELHILAKAYNQTIRQTIDDIVHNEIQTMLKDTNAEIAS